MTGVLSPEMALAYLRELSPAVETAAIRREAEAAWVGDGALAAEAGRLLAALEDAHGDSYGVERLPDGRYLIAARSPGRRAVARAGGGAVPALAAGDLLAALLAVRDRC
jgi:hypothetical protein